MTTLADSPPAEKARRRRGASSVAVGILLSRIAGLVRERVFAHFFGTSLYADAWRAALRMPNVLQNLLGEGTLSASFIPIYAELLEEEREEAAARFAGAILGLLLVTLGALTVVGVLAAPYLVALFFMGFDPERQALTVALVRILFPMAALLVLSAWALGILNSHRHFFISYVAPVFWNLTMIGTLVALGSYLAFSDADLVIALGWGALVGGAVQLAVQLPFVFRLLPAFLPRVSLAVHGVREAIRNFFPVLAGRGVVNLSAWLDYALAAFLATGAVASLGYAQTLHLLPISLFAMSIAASELPELSRTRSAGTSPIAREVSRALERVSFFLIPSTLAYLFFGDVIVAAIFQTGEFGATETLQTYAVLAAYALGLPASSASRVLSSAYYALRDTGTPARIAAGRVAISLVLGAALMFPLDEIAVGEEARLGAAGLALGASAAAWVELFLLRHRLRRRIGEHGFSRSRLLRIVAAGATGSAIGFLALGVLEGLHPLLVAPGTLLPFGVAYLGSAHLLGVGLPLGALLGRSSGDEGGPTQSP